MHQDQFSDDEVLPQLREILTETLKLEKAFRNKEMDCKVNWDQVSNRTSSNTVWQVVKQCSTWLYAFAQKILSIILRRNSEEEFRNQHSLHFDTTRIGDGFQVHRDNTRLGDSFQLDRDSPKIGDFQQFKKKRVSFNIPEDYKADDTTTLVYRSEAKFLVPIKERSKILRRFEEKFKTFSRRKMLYSTGLIIDLKMHKEWLRRSAINVSNGEAIFRRIAGNRLVIAINDYKQVISTIAEENKLPEWSILSKMSEAIID